MASPFSPETREATLAALPAAALDVLVIGGGITGAGVARDAALRGLRVALVDRLDWAAGTSSRSSKLIHGGVRYLEQGDVGLVREAATALCVNHVEATEIAGGEVALRDTLTGRALHARSAVVVNAAGPWVDEVRRRAGALAGVRLHLTRGIHLVVPHARLPVRHIVVMQARDRRSAFAVPRGEVTYLGTTDTDHGPPTDHPTVAGEDADYLLDAANRTFAG